MILDAISILFGFIMVTMIISRRHQNSQFSYSSTAMTIYYRELNTIFIVSVAALTGYTVYFGVICWVINALESGGSKVNEIPIVMMSASLFMQGLCANTILIVSLMQTCRILGFSKDPTMFNFMKTLGSNDSTETNDTQ